MMKILLTGGSGMCGRNILEHHSAKKFDILSPSSSELNLLEKDKVKEYLQQNKPDFIVHTAGLVWGIQFNIKHPVSALVDNSYMGLNLISVAKELGVPRLLNLASSCMYPKLGENPLRETEILKGELEPTNEGYGLAKILTTRLCEYILREEPQLEYKTLIPCNLFGRHDTFSLEFSHMIPAAIQKLHYAKLHKEKTVEIWGDGFFRREFMSASDLADLVFYCLENFAIMPQNLNAGLGHDYSINEYYKVAADVVGFQGTFKHNLTKPVGMRQKLVDVSLLRKFGWKHSLSLEEGLIEAYSFYRDDWHRFKSNAKVKNAFFNES
jgi:GDP-L-fucose synthase